jgi:hypothetical protein
MVSLAPGDGLVKAWHAFARGATLLGVVIVGLASSIGSSPQLDFGGGGTTSVSYKPPPDNPPTYSNAGEDQTVLPSALVQLDGEGYDREGSVSPEWRQETGPAVQLSSTTTWNPTFIAPTVAALTEVRFRLRVFDSRGQVGAKGVDRVSIWVDPDMTPPAPVLLDFETLPDGTPTVPGNQVGSDYQEHCVTFGTFQGNDPSDGPQYSRLAPDKTSVVDVFRKWNPPPETPFDITMFFSAPVNSISADVFTLPGFRVVMTVYDRNNAELAALVSEVSTDCCETKTDTLAFEDVGLIYRARVQTDAPFDAIASIDNVRLERLQHCDPWPF